MWKSWKPLLTKDWVLCVAKTFVQASAGAAAVLAPTQDWTAVRSAVTAVLIGAASAGAAAVWNVLIGRLSGAPGGPCAAPPRGRREKKS